MTTIKQSSIVRNNCASCTWKQIQTADVDAHCYMFREEPNGACAQYEGEATPCGQVSNGIACTEMRAGIQQLCPDCNPWRPA